MTEQSGELTYVTLSVAEVQSNFKRLERAMSARMKYRTTPEACEYLREEHGVRVSQSKLEKHRVTGGGPEFVRMGRNVFHTEPALDAYAATLVSAPLQSTAQYENPRHRRPRKPAPAAEAEPPAEPGPVLPEAPSRRGRTRATSPA